MDTIDPVSTKQGTLTPPITTSVCGQVPTSLASISAPNLTGEPVAAPLELWLRSSTGTSFPNADLDPAERLAATKQKLKVEEGHGPLYSPWQNDQAADTAGKSPEQGKENGCVAD